MGQYLTGTFVQRRSRWPKAADRVRDGLRDNVTKLGTAEPGERAELFVWLDEGGAGMALVTPCLFPQYENSYPTAGPRPSLRRSRAFGQPLAPTTETAWPDFGGSNMKGLVTEAR